MESLEDLAGTLCEDEVCVWSVGLAVNAARLPELEALLSADERERAGRFRFPEHRRRYIVARGHLRLLLGCYVKCAPRLLEFSYGPHGKPSLLSPATDIRFNLSHSHELAFYALSRKREVGIDVERVRADLNAVDLAERFFAADEVEALQNLRPQDRQRGFFDCWTRKEAYLKARGDGIAVELNTFSVSLDPNETSALCRGPEIERWQLVALDATPGYAAAICVEGTGWQLRYLDRII